MGVWLHVGASLCTWTPSCNNSILKGFFLWMKISDPALFVSKGDVAGLDWGCLSPNRCTEVFRLQLPPFDSHHSSSTSIAWGAGDSANSLHWCFEDSRASLLHKCLCVRV